MDNSNSKSPTRSRSRSSCSVTSGSEIKDKEKWSTMNDDIIQWIDGLKFSKAKKNLNRDFSDGVMMAELLHHFYPKYVELHNYPSANSYNSKLTNWEMLARKVFAKIGLALTHELIEGIAASKVGYVEKILTEIHKRILDEERARLEKELAEKEENKPFEELFEEDTCFVLRKSKNSSPSFILYNDIKFIPESTVEDKRKLIANLGEANTELKNKVLRLETLIALKEGTLEDLTNQLHSLHNLHSKIKSSNSDKVF